MTTLEELNEAAIKEAQVDEACMNARRVASVLVNFHQELQDGDLDDNTALQLSLVYARRILGQKS